MTRCAISAWIEDPALTDETALVAELEPQPALPTLPARLDPGTPGDLLRRRLGRTPLIEVPPLNNCRGALSTAAAKASADR